MMHLQSDKSLEVKGWIATAFAWLVQWWGSPSLSHTLSTILTITAIVLTLLQIYAMIRRIRSNIIRRKVGSATNWDSL